MSATVTSHQRRYLALIARARDQRGKPEGDLCEKLAAKMVALHGPRLEERIDLPTITHELRWKDWPDREIIVWASLYFELRPTKLVSSRKHVILVECDEPTFRLLEEAIALARPRLARLMEATAAGFLTAAFPHPDRPGETASDREFTDAELAAQAAGLQGGYLARPRKAIKP